MKNILDRNAQGLAGAMLILTMICFARTDAPGTQIWWVLALGISASLTVHLIVRAVMVQIDKAADKIVLRMQDKS